MIDTINRQPLREVSGIGCRMFLLGMVGISMMSSFSRIKGMQAVAAEDEVARNRENLQVGRMLMREAASDELVKARALFEEASLSQNLSIRAWAYLELAKLYYLGLGVNPDKESMYRYLLKSTQLAQQVEGLEEILEIARIIQDKKLDLELKDASGKTPLLRAVEAGHKELVEFLVAKGSDILAIDKNGLSALQLAAKNNHLEVLKILVAAGADPKSVFEVKGDGWNPKNGRSLLHFAARKGQKPLLMELVRLGVDVLAIDACKSPLRVCGYTALHRVAKYGNHEGVETLLSAGAQVNAKDSHGRIPLHYARSRRVVDMLIEAGSKINAKDDEDGDTPLHCAASNGRLEAAERLIELGINVDSLCAEYWTPLHMAISSGQKAMVELLIQKKSDVQTIDKLGQPLLCVVFDHRTEGKRYYCDMVDLLLSKGASVNSSTDDGSTPLHSIVWGGKDGSDLPEFDKDTQIEIMNKFIARGADPRSVDNCNLTPLHLASFGEAVTILIEAYKAAVNKDVSRDRLIEEYIHMVDNEGNTPLHRAASSGYTEVVEELIKNRAKHDVRNKAGKTPL